MEQYAGYGCSTYGPCFGGGNDFYTSGDFRTTAGYCNPHSFNWTNHNDLAGGSTFTVKEIETYQITFGAVVFDEISDSKKKKLTESLNSSIVDSKYLKSLNSILPEAKSLKLVY